MDMTKRDYQILLKIAKSQSELVLMIKEFKIKRDEDLNTIHSVVRRGLAGFISDIFELTKPLSESIQKILPFNRIVIKRFRDTASHRYGALTNEILYACLSHCIEKTLIQAVNKLIKDYEEIL